MLKKVIKVTFTSVLTAFAIFMLGAMIFGTIVYILEHRTIGWLTMLCGDIVVGSFIYIMTKTLNKMVYTKRDGSN